MVFQKHFDLFALLIICLLAVICFANGFSNEFLWDDEFYIQRNTYLKSFSHIIDIFTSSSTGGAGNSDRFYRPLQFFLYLIVYQLSGESTFAFHALNLVIHILCAITFYFLVIEIWQSRLLALFSGLIWLCHPIHVESITYVSATADSLAALFMLLTILFFWQSRKDNKPVYYILSLSCFILALFSKEASSVTAAALILLAYFQKNNLKSALAWATPYWLALVMFFLFRIYVVNMSGTFNFYDQPNIYTENIIFRIYTFLAAVTEYFYILIYPVGLHMERGFPVFVEFFNYRTVCAAIFVLISLIYTWLHRHNLKNRYIFAFFWFFTFFIPMSGVLVPVNSMLLEHWLYLTSMGWFVLLGSVLTKIYTYKPRVALAVCTLIVACLSTLTIQQNQVWATPISLYSDIVSHNGGSARVLNNLAMAYADSDQLELAEEYYLKAIAKADAYAETHYNLARIYIKQNRLELARNHLRKSLEINSQFKYARDLQQELELFLKNSATPD